MVIQTRKIYLIHNINVVLLLLLLLLLLCSFWYENKIFTVVFDISYFKCRFQNGSFNRDSKISGIEFVVFGNEKTVMYWNDSKLGFPPLLPTLRFMKNKKSCDEPNFTKPVEPRLFPSSIREPSNSFGPTKPQLHHYTQEGIMWHQFVTVFYWECRTQNYRTL